MAVSISVATSTFFHLWALRAHFVAAVEIWIETSAATDVVVVVIIEQHHCQLFICLRFQYPLTDKCYKRATETHKKFVHEKKRR